MRKRRFYSYYIYVSTAVILPLIALLAIGGCQATAQTIAPPIQWQKSFGTANVDEAQALLATRDGGCVVAGYSQCNNVPAPTDSNGYHVYIIKLDMHGNLQWQQTLGGSGWDKAYAITFTNDGGYAIAGASSSANGNVSRNKGGWDYWLVKLDANGNLVFQNTYGGSGDDIATAIVATPDDGFVLAGSSTSSNGDVTQHHGDSSHTDYWIVKLANDGGIDWQKSIGGTGNEYATSLQLTPNYGMMVTGYANSTDGDVRGNHGNYDFFTVLLNANGGIEWTKCYGSSGDDEAQCISPCNDGGYIMAGFSDSANADVSSIKGGFDYWVVKINDRGMLQWQKTYGGANGDWAKSIVETQDSGFVVAGQSWSSDGDISGNQGLDDYCVLKLDINGNIQWQSSIGGSSYDHARAIAQTIDGDYLLAGYSASPNGDISNPKGNADFWIVKLSPYPDTTLPLTLTSFKASLTNKMSVLTQWQTAQEINTHQFVVQHSSHPTNHFTNICTLDAVGKGNNNYQYTHTTPSIGINYYRLQMLDKDGKFTYSPIVSCTIAKPTIANDLFVYPNPAKDRLTLSINSKESLSTTIKLINMEGKTLQTIPVSLLKGNTIIPINITTLPKGVYTIQLTNNGMIQKSFEKQ